MIHRFQPQKKLGACQNPAYRSFLSKLEPNTEFTYRGSFIRGLKQDEELRKGGIPCPFYTIWVIYHIIASEWVVVNTCFQRELNTIEWNLENENLGIGRLHEHLKSLYITRRRITLYEILIKEQRDACRQYGRKHWNQPSSPGNQELIENVVSTLETDFAFVSDLAEKNQERVTKNINLLIALVSVAEGRVGISNGKRIEALTLVAMFLLPFSLVSSVMNINGEFGPGQRKQYIFWAVSTPISLVLILAYILYSRTLAS